MKNITIIIISCVLLSFLYSCDEKQNPDISFKDVEKNSILDYITQNQDKYSSFLKILQKAGLDKTLSAYNPNGNGYTLFLPDNAAIDEFLKTSKYSSVDELLNDEQFAWYFTRYHVVNEEINSNDFPFGALSSMTLTEDYLSVSFIVEEDTSYYKINNQAAVIGTNIEMSNGYIHLIGVALAPITFTSYTWLEDHDNFSIFREAVENTGFDELLSIVSKDDAKRTAFTLLLEPDSIYNKAGIYNFTDLADRISPGNTNYTDRMNPLYNFVGYHIIDGNYFLNDFMENDNGDRISTNYTTNSEIPLFIDGTGMDIMINHYKQIFDTIIHGIGDTTFINYVGFNYDASNVVTQSGVVHIIDQVMEQQSPTRQNQYYEIRDPYFWTLDSDPGTYVIEDSTLLSVIRYSGAELEFVRLTAAEAPNALWSDDYLHIDGDFSISFTTDKLIQGNYRLWIQADFFNTENAVVEIYIDGKAIGGTLDLAVNPPNQTATGENPYLQTALGTINFVRYQSHVVTVKSLIPGQFSWDFIRFEPI